MKKYPIIADIALFTGLLAFIAAPSLAVTMPTVGAAAGYAVLDSTTANTQAKADAQNAYNQLLAMACTADMTDKNLNNQILTAGVYCFSTPTFLQGQVLFDAKGDQNAVFVMKMASRFDAWPDSTVVLLNGAQPQNIFWLAGGAVTLGTSVDFVGTVLTMAPIAFGRGGDSPVFDERGIVNGRLWSIGNTVTVPARGVSVGFVAPLPNIYTIPQQQYQRPIQGTVQQSNNALLSVIVNEPGFIPFVNGMRVTSGMKTPFAAGTYTVSEINTSATNYGAPTFSGSCTQNGLTGVITLNAGDDKVCVINNTPVMGWVAAPVAVCASGCAPTMPNTGFGGSALPMLNGIGLLLVTGFVWTERSSVKRSS